MWEISKEILQHSKIRAIWAHSPKWNVSGYSMSCDLNKISGSTQTINFLRDDTQSRKDWGEMNNILSSLLIPIIFIVEISAS